jgi:hypothetical protein
MLDQPARMGHCTTWNDHSPLCDRDGRYCSQRSTHDGPCTPHGTRDLISEAIADNRRRDEAARDGTYAEKYGRSAYVVRSSTTDRAILEAPHGHPDGPRFNGPGAVRCHNYDEHRQDFRRDTGGRWHCATCEDREG